MSMIVNEGMRFTASFVNQPLCSPSRASLLTGLSAHNHHSGSYQDLVAKGFETNSLGPWLQAAGYKTALIGKYINGYNAAAGVPPGWNEWQGKSGSGYYNYTINNNGTLEHYGANEADYSTDVLAGKAEAFIDAQHNDPFFLLLTPRAPHGASSDGAIPAPRHQGLYNDLPFHGGRAFNERNVADKPGFVGAFPLLDQAAIDHIKLVYRNGREALLAVDDMVARVIAALERNGKLANTYVIFTSDNGHLHGQHRIGGKTVIYDEAIRVPLAIRGPGIGKGKHRAQLVNNLDVTATIVDLAQASPTHALDGKSLKPLFRGPAPLWRSALLVSGRDPKPGERGIVGRVQAIRTPTHLFAEHQAKASFPYGKEDEFYDLAADPRQLRSRHDDADSQLIIEGLRSILDDLRDCAGETCWR
jgi:arylsulfatase A-like enzyme